MTGEYQQGTKLHIRWTDYASANLNDRITKLKRSEARVDIDARLESIQFLRNVGSRASHLLPTLYLHLAASTTAQVSGNPYDAQVLAATIEYSSLQSISLGCRSVFDDGRGRMTGKRFANITDATLESLAAFWSESSGRPINNAIDALRLLRLAFRRCAQQKRLLLDAPSLLERRVELLKYRADRSAAHITLESYHLHLLEMIHVVAAIAVVGAMIVDFDSSHRGDRYFDTVDEVGWNAAKAIFPILSGRRLFHNFHIHGQATLYWRIKELDGLGILLDRLPTALGYWDSSKESV